MGKEISPETKKHIIAYNYIKSKIINNKYRGGEIISENQIASELNMSRTPVREGLKILSNENYVDIHKGVGIVVRHVTLKEVYDINALRLVLECFAIHRVCSTKKYHQIDSLLARWKELRKRIKENKEYKEKELLDIDTETHTLLIRQSGNDALLKIYNELDEKIRRYQKLFIKIANDDGKTVDFHINILSAVRDGRADDACRILEQHVNVPLNTIEHYDMDILNDIGGFGG